MNGGLGEERLSELAHELKTPLAVIVGFAELLRVRDDPKTRQQAPIAIQGAAARLTRAIDELLVELGAAAPEPPPTGGTGLVLVAPANDEPRPGRRVVLVDDDDDLRRLVRATLPDGFEVSEARNGQEGVDLIAESGPDLVLLDWQMPERTGEGVLRELAKRGIRVPVIVLTADIEPARRQVSEALGAKAFMTKPFSPIELLSEIERLLG